MYNFEYVEKSTWAPVKENIESILHEVQNLVRHKFTFSYTFIGSASRNMVTCDFSSNVGFDFDISLENRENHRADSTDSEMHNCVWSEAAQLRSSGELLRTFKKIKSNLFIIHGSDDPHPVKGVIQPLEENGVECETYILEKCGHSPFMEKHAKEKFYEILVDIVV